MAAIAAKAISPATKTHLKFRLGLFSVFRGCGGFSVSFKIVWLMTQCGLNASAGGNRRSFGKFALPYECKNRGNEEKSRDGSKNKPADNRSSQGGILFAALSETERHWNHSNNHRERGHQDRPQPRVTGIQRGEVRIPIFFEPLLRKRHN